MGDNALQAGVELRADDDAAIAGAPKCTVAVGDAACVREVGANEHPGPGHPVGAHQNRAGGEAACMDRDVEAAAVRDIV